MMSATCCPFQVPRQAPVTTTNNVVAYYQSNYFPKERITTSNHIVRRHLFLFLFIAVKEDNELCLSSSSSFEINTQKQ
jgi:hypothetical protein